MPWFNIFLNKKVILTMIVALLLATAWYMFTGIGETIMEQNKKIEQLELNQTFMRVDNTVEIENTITVTNAKNREGKIEEMKKEMRDEKHDDIDSTYDESIFDGMYLYKTDLP